MNSNEIVSNRTPSNHLSKTDNNIKRQRNFRLPFVNNDAPIPFETQK